MGLLDWIGNAAGVKTMQAGSDVYITRYTTMDALVVPQAWRNIADEAIKQRFLNTDTVRNEFDAALLKLSIYWCISEREEMADGMLVFGLCIDKIREAGDGQLNPGLSLEVMGLTGH